MTIRHYPQEIPFKCRQDRDLPAVPANHDRPNRPRRWLGAGDTDSDGAISCRFAIAPLKARAIAFGKAVAFLSSVIPAQAGIQRPKTRHSPRIPACAGMTALSCARVWGACGTINLSSDDTLDVLQISCRSRARSRTSLLCHSRLRGNEGCCPPPFRVRGCGGPVVQLI